MVQLTEALGRNELYQRLVERVDDLEKRVEELENASSTV